MIQKIIRVGNSLAITLPKSFTQSAAYTAGQEVEVQTNADLRAVYIKPTNASGSLGLTPEFKEWLDEISEKEAGTIKALAHI